MVSRLRSPEVTRANLSPSTPDPARPVSSHANRARYPDSARQEVPHAETAAFRSRTLESAQLVPESYGPMNPGADKQPAGYEPARLEFCRAVVRARVWPAKIRDSKGPEPRASAVHAQHPET